MADQAARDSSSGPLCALPRPESDRVGATRRRRWWVGALTTLTALAAALAAWSPAVGARPAAHDASCASLGDAADYAVFSQQGFDATQSRGTSIAGNIAAGEDVTLDGVSVTGNIVTAGNFTAGRTTGHGGSVTGSVQYAGTADVAQNFTVSGGVTHVSPPAIDVPTTFSDLMTLSATLADLDQTAGATVALNQYSNALELTGTATGLNVFTVSAAQLTTAAGIVIDLTQPGATALINVTTDTDLTIGPQYMNLAGSATAAGIVWNLALATTMTVTTGVSWQGLILAPNATVTALNGAQLHGQLIARDVGGTVPATSSSWVIYGTPTTVCLPPPPPPTPPDDSLQLTALCVDANGDLDMRLRNTGTATRTGAWLDLHGSDYGTFTDPAGSELYFVVQDPTPASVIQATSGTTTVTAAGTTTRCQGRITVEKTVSGDAPAGQTWAITVTGGASGNQSTAMTLGAGDSETITVPGGYQPGVAAIDQVVGGIPYTVTEDDPAGATASISVNPVVILDGENEIVVVTNTYSGGAGPEVPPPTEPTLPPGAPDPPVGPDLVPGVHGADLAITHSVAPRRLPVDGVVTTVTRVRNLGPVAAVGVVAREIPQLRPNDANSVAHVLTLTTSRGTCTQRRPVRCALGTLAPGAVVTIRTRTRVLVAATLHSVVVVSSDTPDPNTTNNMANAGLVTEAVPVIHAHVSAPASVAFGSRFTYRAGVSVTGRFAATAVRLCTRPPAGLLTVRAPGTYRLHGSRCRNFGTVQPGHTAGFQVSGVASRSGRLTIGDVATAVDARSSRASAPVVVGAVAACPALSRRARPVARAAC